LPALPRAWPSGSVQGLKARGGFEVSLEWHDGRLTRASIHASQDRPCLMRLGELTARFELHAGDVLELNDQLQRIGPRVSDTDAVRQSRP
jgi:alpha-L-fucosidase 2